MVAEWLVPNNAPIYSCICPLRLSPRSLSNLATNPHRHIHCSVGREINSRLLSAQSCPPDPSVNGLSLDIETVKKFILCFTIYHRTTRRTMSGACLYGNDSFSPQTIQPYPFVVLLLPSLTPSAKCHTFPRRRSGDRTGKGVANWHGLRHSAVSDIWNEPEFPQGPDSSAQRIARLGSLR